MYSKLKSVFFVVFVVVLGVDFFVVPIDAAKVAKQAVAQSSSTTANTTATEEKPPTIDWGQCPQLAPKESERVAKARVLESCLGQHPVPQNLTQQTIETHQKSMAKCALKKEKWFSKSGSYRYSKAESEIKAKKLIPEMEKQLLSDHKKCESEAKQEFPKREAIVEQIQLYQACMDFHITKVCGIKLSNN
ncbi:uncharacterized protein LOC128955402 [Oppia nitens]|uniref:uncharacterized protein LOC128955402 n=1 Tax=Oppia nitens TaxID=1686743 RepID=UPI0023DC488D|nr:uncharacterized protein LOC128955402 [Oppia nitens]